MHRSSPVRRTPRIFFFIFLRKRNRYMRCTQLLAASRTIRRCVFINGWLHNVILVVTGRVAHQSWRCIALSRPNLLSTRCMP